MTLLDIRNQIVSSLVKKDTFVKSDFATIKLQKTHETDRDDLIRASLGELCDAGLIRRVGESDTWILSGPMNAQGQNIHLSMETCNAVAEEINAFLDAHEIQGPRADALRISEGDIVALLGIIEAVIGDEMEDDQ